MQKSARKSSIVIILLMVALLLTVTLGVSLPSAMNATSDDRSSAPLVADNAVTTLPSWSLNSDESMVFYGERTKQYSRKHEKQPFNEGPDGYMDVTVDALHVKLAANDVFTYNKVIDLSKLDPLTPVFKMGVMPDDGKRDARFIYFEFTDVYDPSIKMTIQISTGVTSPDTLVWANSWTIYSYLMAKTGPQIYTALVNDEITQGKNGNIYGSIAKFGLYGQRAGYRACSDYLSIYYDYNEKQLYQQSIYGRMLICDFDDLAHFSSLFDGFTTGEVVLSMYGSTYYTDSLNVFFYEIAGETAFSENITDVTPPHIYVDAPSEITPGIVGGEYPLFGASVRDPYGCAKLQTQVIYGYGSDSAYNVSVKDGKFTPDREGIYTVVYTADNEYGAHGEEIIDITVKPSDYMPIAVGDLVDESGYVGKTTVVKMPDVTGGVGDVTLSATVVFDGNVVAVNNGKFIPEAAGEYKVTVTATDAFGRKAQSEYKVTASVADAPIIDEAAIKLPKYFIKGKTYELPKVYAYDYVNGKRKKNTAVAVTGGTLTGNKLTPTASVCDISYVAVRGGKSSCVTRTVPVIDVSGASAGSIDIAKYFATENIETTKTDEYIEFAATGNARAEFINKFVADDFSSTFMFPDSIKDGAKITVVLSDIYSENKLEIEFVREGGAVALMYNGTRRASYPLNEYARISYGTVKNALYYTTDRYFVLDGFDGFDSGYLYFAIEADNGVKVRISELYGQGINNLDYDNIRPNIAAAGEYEFEIVKDSLVKVFSARYADALDPITTATVTVTSPSGEPIIATDGTKLDGASADREYEFYATEYGYYNIEYAAETADYMQFENYSFMVVDMDAPTLQVDGSIPSSFGVGDSWIVPQVTAQDNVDRQEDMTVKCLVHEIKTHKIQVYSIGDTVVFERAGQYTVSFMTKDAAGNTTTVEFAVTVK